MTRFGITWVTRSGQEPYVITSEPDDLQVVYEALQSLIPSARMSKSDAYSWTKSPQMVVVTFDRLDGKDFTVRMWLVAKFGDLGWEPYAEAGTEVGGGGIYYLRKSFD